jgi:hypothetical protein
MLWLLDLKYWMLGLVNTERANIRGLFFRLHILKGFVFKDLILESLFDVSVQAFEVSIYLVQCDQVDLYLCLAFLLWLYLLEHYFQFVESFCFLLLVNTDFLITDDTQSTGSCAYFVLLDIIELPRDNILV